MSLQRVIPAEESTVEASASTTQTPTTQNSESRISHRARKGHSKSRTGCYNCKKARVKCKENRPSCDYCSLRELKCEWPDLQIRRFKQQCSVAQEATLPPLIPSIQPHGPSFDMQDFRLFNHFIQAAYPHIPRDDSVWTHEIPSIASGHDFLLHSMLALSASDIMEVGPSSPHLRSVALNHRVKAISSLAKAIETPLESVERGNAMIATCFSLVFQSVLMDDGLVEFMTFLRGVVTVSVHMARKKLKFLFQHMFDLTDAVVSKLGVSVLIDQRFSRGACQSLELMCPLVHNSHEVEYYKNLLNSAQALLTSSQDAYSCLSKIYTLFSYEMSQQEFSDFVNPTNEVGKLLQTHFCALRLVMAPIISHESFGRNARTTSGVGGTSTRWLGTLVRHVDPKLAKYYEWPIWVLGEADTGKLELG